MTNEQKIENTSKQMLIIIQVYINENNLDDYNFKRITSVLENCFNVKNLICEKNEKEKFEQYLISCIKCVEFFAKGFLFSGKTGELFLDKYYTLESQVSHLMENI